VHFGATQRTQGVKLHVRDTDKTQGDRGARVDLKDESRPTSQQLHSSHRDKKNIKFIWHKTPASTANTKIEKTTTKLHRNATKTQNDHKESLNHGKDIKNTQKQMFLFFNLNEIY